MSKATTPPGAEEAATQTGDEPLTHEQRDEADRGQTKADQGLGRRMGFATLLLVASVFLSRVVGFVREVVIAAQQGATGATDAYYAAFTLPDVLNYFLAGGTLTITFIPLFSAALARGDEEGGWRLFSTVATGTALLIIPAVIVGELIAPWAVPWLLPGFSSRPEQLALCVHMTRIVMPGMLCFTIGGLLQATLLARERFAHVATIPIVYNLMIILGGVALGPWLGVEGFAWGALAGAIVGPLLIPLWASRGQIRYRPRFDFRSPGFKRYLRLALPLMIGATLISLDEWLLRYFGSHLDQGVISQLNNARRLMLVPVAIVGHAAGQAAMPFLSRLWSEGRHDELAQTLTRAVRTVVFYAIFAAAALASLASPIVFAAFHRGKFSAADAAGTAPMLMAFALGVVAWSAQGLVARGFYARHDTLRPMILGTLIAAASLPVYASLGRLGAGVGLATASSLSISVNALVLTLFFRRWCAPISLRAIAASAARAAACALPGAAAAYGALHALNPTLNIQTSLGAIAQLIIGATLFGVVSLGAAFAINAQELAFLRTVITKIRARLGLTSR